MGRFSAFQAERTGSNPVVRKCSLGETGKHDRLKICRQFASIGSSPIASMVFLAQ